MRPPYLAGKSAVGRTRVDDRGRLLVPVDERKRLGLKPGTEMEIGERGGMLVLKPVIPKPLKVRSRKGKWGSETFLDAGEATFGR